MKTVIKIKVKQHPLGVEEARKRKIAPMVYPNGYRSDKVQVLCYKQKKQAQKYNYCLGVCDSAFAEKLVADNPNDVEILDKTTAITTGKEWRPQVEKITDEKAVMKVLAKKVLGGRLLQSDMDIINPEHKARGIGKSQLFDDMLKDYGV